MEDSAAYKAAPARLLHLHDPACIALASEAELPLANLPCCIALKQVSAIGQAPNSQEEAWGKPSEDKRRSHLGGGVI